MSRPPSSGVVPLVTILLLLAMSGCAQNQTPERNFTTRAEAQQGGGFDAGWLPASSVPASGRNIRERRDLGADEVWTRFEFDTADRDAVSAGCTGIGQQDVALPGAATRGIGWWPEMLRSDPGVAAGQFHLYRCPGGPGRAFLAVHRTIDTAFYWRIK